jgi:hypothetical protein
MIPASAPPPDLTRLAWQPVTVSQYEFHPVVARTVVAILSAGISVLGPEAAAAAVTMTPATEAGVMRAFNAIGRRRLAHACEVVEIAADVNDVDVESFLHTVLRDDAHQEFVARCIAVAQDASLRGKRIALARSLAQAAAGDDAVLDDEFLFLRAVADLDAPHIRILHRLDMTRAGTGPMEGHLLRDGWRNATLAEHEPGLADALPALLRTVEIHSLVVRDNTYSRLEDDPMWRITDRGKAMLARLSD